jgi:hypothetical protein
MFFQREIINQIGLLNETINRINKNLIKRKLVVVAYSNVLEKNVYVYLWLK